MDVKAEEVVLFIDIQEGDSEPHFGVLFENGFILCLCCGEFVESSNCDILKHYPWEQIDTTLLALY